MKFCIWHNFVNGYNFNHTCFVVLDYVDWYDGSRPLKLSLHGDDIITIGD